MLYLRILPAQPCRFFFIGMLIAAGVWILSPFLTSIIWAAMIVVTTWPALLALQARLRNKRGPAVALMTVLLLLIIVVPFSLVIAAIIAKAGDIVAWVKSLAAFTVPPPKPFWRPSASSFPQGS